MTVERNLTVNFSDDSIEWTGCNQLCGLVDQPGFEHVSVTDFYCMLHVLTSGNLYFCAHPDSHKFLDGSLKLCLVRAGKMKDANIKKVKKRRIIYFK